MEWFCTSEGRTLAYNVMGAGPMLVCHPGGPGFAGAELGDLGGLSRSRTLVLLDPRGTGGSDPAPDYSFDGYAADLDQLRAHLGLTRMDLLGFSHGGSVAIHYAATYPDGVDRLVLAGAVVAVDDEAKKFADEYLESKSGEPWHDDAVAALAGEDNGNVGDIAGLWVREAPLFFSNWDERYLPAVLAEGVGASSAPLEQVNTAKIDLRSELARITATTLVVSGRDDFLCRPQAANELARDINGARLVMIEDAGHMMFIEQPDAFREAVAAFLAG